jgi:hypothetical protein
VAHLVAVAAASHAPLITAAPEAAEPAARERLMAGFAALRAELAAARPDVVVVCANEHFTNFFLDNFPAFCIGIADHHAGPSEPWLGIPRTTVPGHRTLGRWLLDRMLAADFDPAFSEELCLDHGIMTVLHFLTPGLTVPVVPIIQNCAVPPMPSLRRCYRLGAVLRDAVLAWPGPARVALLGSGGLSHTVGAPGMGRVDAAFDRWLLDRLGAGAVEEVLALTDADVGRAGNGTHEIRSWLTAAGAVDGRPARLLAYEPIPAWATGMGVVSYGAGPVAAAGGGAGP